MASRDPWIPRLGRCACVEVEVGADVVVPESEDIEISLAHRSVRLAKAKRLLERGEEPLDATVLPRGVRRRPLMADAEACHHEAKEPAAKRRLIVGAQALGWAESLDDVEQDTEDGERGLLAQAEEGQARPGAVIEEAEHGALIDEGQVEGQTVLLGTGRGRRCLSSRRRRRISGSCRRTKSATKVLPTVIPPCCSKRTLKVSAIFRHPW